MPASKALVSFYLICVLVLPLSALVYENDPKELLNWCIDARNHKTSPGPTNNLHRQCKPWEKRSCCTAETTVSLHNEKMYHFDWDHCRHVKPLSEKCRNHFVQDLCFYECSPNTGPWVVKVAQKIRRERFMDIPLCATDCNNWFEDCADDFTCTDNWVRNFDWNKNGNICPVGSSCRTYREIYQNAERFCETVWDNSWLVTPDNEHCMRLWFNGSEGNPNDAVALWKFNRILKTHKLALPDSTNPNAANALTYQNVLVAFLTIVISWLTL